jgi:hypothetical protein
VNLATEQLVAFAVIAANIASAGFYFWRAFRLGRAREVLEREAASLRRATEELRATQTRFIDDPRGLSDASMAITLAGPRDTTPDELRDAMRFGAAAPQQYLDGLAAERRAANDA